MDQSKQIHYRYIIGFLVFSNILVFAARYVEDAQTVAFISFAATMVSLVLSLLAIVYAFFSNASLTSITTTMQHASASLAGESAKLGSLLTSLQATVSEIPTRLAENTTQIIKAIGNQSASAPQPQAAVAAGAGGITEAQATQLINRASLVGVRVMNLILIGHKHGKTFGLKTAGAIIDPTSVDHITGYFMAMSACGYFTYIAGDISKYEVKIVAVAPDFERLYTEKLVRLKGNDDAKWMPSTSNPAEEKWDVVMSKLEAFLPKA